MASNNEFVPATNLSNIAAATGRTPATRSTPSATLDQIWRTHAPRILRVTQSITRNREDAEDALQDSFLNAYVHLHGFDGRSSLATWLTRIAINSALMILRKRTSRSQVSLDEKASTGFDLDSLARVDQSPSPEEQYEQIERRQRVRSAVGKLRPALRQALELQTLEERSIKETAEKMGLSIAATKARTFHARAALRKSLARGVGPTSGRTRHLHLSLA